MARYTFIKDFQGIDSRQTFGGAVLPLILFKKGEVVEGTPNNDGKTITPSNKIVLEIPLAVLQVMTAGGTAVQDGSALPNGGMPVKGNWWTNMSGMNKVILIGIVAIGGYYALKHFNVIK